MNPLTLIPAAYMGWAKVAAVGALVAAVLAGVAWVRHDWIQDGITIGKAECAADKQTIAEAALKASEAARAKEQALTTANERIRHALVKEKADRVAAAAALDDSLRQLQAALGNPAGGDPQTSAGAHGAGGLESELLGHCAQALAGLAGQADRLESKVVGLQSYVAGVVFGSITGKTAPADYTIKPPMK